jgi:hypothetical protein
VVAILAGGCSSLGLLHHPGSRPLPPDYVPVGVGPTAAYRPPPRPAASRAGARVDGQRCSRARGPRVGAHLEIFARGHVVAIPAGVGIAPPLRRDVPEGRVLGGRCYYPAITTDPTGLIELARDAPHTLGQFFAIWGQPLTRARLAGFAIPARAPIVAYVGGVRTGVRRWRGDAAAIPLSRHTRIVLELLSHVPPHRSYVFPPGL